MWHHLLYFTWWCNSGWRNQTDLKILGIKGPKLQNWNPPFFPHACLVPGLLRNRKRLQQTLLWLVISHSSHSQLHSVYFSAAWRIPRSIKNLVRKLRREKGRRKLPIEGKLPWRRKLPDREEGGFLYLEQGWRKGSRKRPDRDHRDKKLSVRKWKGSFLVPSLEERLFQFGRKKDGSSLPEKPGRRMLPVRKEGKRRIPGRELERMKCPEQSRWKLPSSGTRKEEEPYWKQRWKVGITEQWCVREQGGNKMLSCITAQLSPDWLLYQIPVSKPE